MSKPYSAACDNNREPILSVIEKLFADCSSVLEIGSGTGQHAVYFADKLPHLTWQCSDLPEHHPGIEQWLEEAALDNTPSPLTLDVCQSPWPELEVDAVFSANAVHIMSWEAVKAMIAGVADLLSANGLLVLYGPFNYGGNYTSESNARFDGWLKDRDPLSGIRDFEDLEGLANAGRLFLQGDFAMPANNRILYFEKG